MIIFWSSGTTGKPKGIAHGQNFLMKSLIKSQFSAGILLQTTCFFHTGMCVFSNRMNTETIPPDPGVCLMTILLLHKPYLDSSQGRGGGSQKCPKNCGPRGLNG